MVTPFRPGILAEEVCINGLAGLSPFCLSKNIRYIFGVFMVYFVQKKYISLSSLSVTKCFCRRKTKHKLVQIA